LGRLLAEEHHLLEGDCRVSSPNLTSDLPPVWGKDAKWLILSHNAAEILKRDMVLDEMLRVNYKLNCRYA